MTDGKIMALVAGALIGGIAVTLFYQTQYPIDSLNQPIITSNLPDVVEGCNDINIIATANSINTNPKRWDTDNYYLYTKVIGNSDDPYYFGVWVANEHYGLDLASASARDIGPVIDLTKRDYDMSDQCRDLLYKAVTNWKKNDIFNKLK